VASTVPGELIPRACVWHGPGRPLALNRKNALFAGHDRGADHWAIVASLIETCKLNSVDPQAYLASVLSRLVNSWPMRRIDELMPWAYAIRQNATAAA
jgi:hypothetical protein